MLRQAKGMKEADEIKEEIAPSNDEFNMLDSAKDDPAGSGSMIGIDQSIDTYRMDDYDYMEDVKWLS